MVHKKYTLNLMTEFERIGYEGIRLMNGHLPAYASIVLTKLCVKWCPKHQLLTRIRSELPP